VSRRATDAEHERQQSSISNSQKATARRGDRGVERSLLAVFLWYEQIAQRSRKHACEVSFDDVITLACSLFQSFGIVDDHVFVVALDEASAMEAPGA
jgi:hypothetical protein